MSGESKREAIARTITAASSDRCGSAPAGKPVMPWLGLTARQREADRLALKATWALRFVRITATLGAMCEWEPAYNGEPVDSALARQLVARILPEQGSQKTMRQRSLSLQRRLGTHATVSLRVDRNGQPSEHGLRRWAVLHPDRLVKAKEGNPKDWCGVQFHPDAKKPTDFGWWETPKSAVDRLLIPDEDYPLAGWSPLMDVIEDMRRYVAGSEAVESAADQHKVMSALLVLQSPEESDIAEYDEHDGPGPGLTAEEIAIRDYANTARKAYDKGGVHRFLPHPFMWPGDVDLLKVGDPINLQHIQALNELITLGSIALPVPTQWLIAGEGTSNHWGDAEQRRALHQQAVYPALEDHDSYWSEQALRPLVHASIRNGETIASTWGDLDNWSLVSRRSDIDVKPDNAGQLLELAKCGVISRHEAAAAVNAEPLEIGVTEYEHWLNMNRIGPGAADPDARPEEPVPDPMMSAALALL